MTLQVVNHPRGIGRSALPEVTQRFSVGSTGLSVGPICLGWVKDPNTVSAAFEAGVNFFFVTADLHWPMYEGTRNGLAALLRRGRGVRDQIVVAAASYITQSEFMYGPLNDLLSSIPRLRRLDMLVIGGAHSNDFATRQKVYGEFVLREEFGARGIGTSFHDRAAAVTAINESMIDIAFVRYNPVHSDARVDLFPKLGQSSARIFNFKSMVGYTAPRRLAVGVPAENWRPKPTDYYRFALSHPAIDGILCALRHPREVAALVRALRSPPLEQAEQLYLIELAKLSTGKTRLIGRPVAGPLVPDD